MGSDRPIDVAIVGGGTAGALLAGELVAGSGLTVGLFEDGPDEFPTLSHRLADQPQLLKTDALRRIPERRPDGAGATLLSGRVFGGGWSVNHGVMMMPTQGDLEAIAAVGGQRWSIERLQELALRITTDLDRVAVAAPDAGVGPIPLARPLVDPGRISPATAALLEACGSMGVPWTDDVNRDASKANVSSYAYSSDRGRRVSSATAILGPVRGRPNLVLSPSTQVRRLIIRGSRVVALKVGPSGGNPGPTARVEVGRVVLCAGAFHTPQILLRSGIGPADDLRELGLQQVIDLPGVGSGFRDHAKYEPALHLIARAEDVPRGGEPWADDPFGDRNKLHLRLRSAHAGTEPDLDLQLHHDIDGGRVVLTVRILEQRSPGTVRLDPDDVLGNPCIESGMLEDPLDVEVILEGVLRGLELLQHRALGGRYRLPADAPRSDDVWRRAILSGYGSYNHGVGTCRMGSGDLSVVDSGLRVHGIENLFIADASVLPILPHVTTNYLVAIVGRWAAEHFLATW